MIFSEGLLIMQAVHVPVMSAEVAKYLRAEKGGRFLDGTLGLGGH